MRRNEEIKRLTKQLEELRAAKERLSKGEKAPAAPTQGTAASSSSSVPSAMPMPAAKPPVPRGKLQVGKHGENSRFLSLSPLGGEEYLPRIFTVAGRIPDLTVKQLLETPLVLQNRPPNAGNMFLTMLPEGYDGQIIALPGLEILSQCKDPVVVLSNPADISSVKIPVADGDDVILVIERNIDGIEFDKNKFYAWADGDFVRIGWMKEPPADQGKIIGKVMFGMLEVEEEMRSHKSCFKEENETYN